MLQAFLLRPPISQDELDAIVNVDDPIRRRTALAFNLLQEEHIREQARELEDEDHIAAANSLFDQTDAIPAASNSSASRA